MSRKTRRRYQTKIPISIVAGGAVGLVKGWGGGSALGSFMAGSYEDGIKQVISQYSPYNPYTGRFLEMSEMNGLKGLVGGAIVHATVGRFVNRYLRSVPFVNL